MFCVTHFADFRPECSFPSRKNNKEQPTKERQSNVFKTKQKRVSGKLWCICFNLEVGIGRNYL